MKYFKFKFLFVLLTLAMAIPPAWADETIVCDGGSTTTEYLPVYGYYFDYAQHNQMIYPASELQDLPSGALINSITFHPTAALAFSGATVTIKMSNASNTAPFSTDAYGSATPLDATSFTQVAAVTPSGDNPWTITLDDQFEYTGGDLIIDIESPAASYGSNNFYGKNVGSNYGYYAYGSYTKKAITILPKVTIDYDAEAKPYAAKATPSSLAFSKLLPNGEETLNITLKNTGANPITPTLSGLSVPFSTTYTPAQLAAGDQVTIPIKFNPTATGSYSAMLTIGAAESSEVAAQVTMTGLCSTDITIEDGTDENGYLPLYYPSYYTQQNQMIYPATDLTALVGKTITGMTFYSTGLTFDGTYNVSLGTTDQTTYASATAIEGLTQVVTGHTSTTGVTEFVITFDTPFEYNGGNLVFQIEVTDKGTSSYTQSIFYGVNQSGATGYYKYDASYGTYGYTRSFLPKVTFDYESGNTPMVASIAIDPETQTINDAAAGSLTITGTDVEGNINASLASNTDWYLNPTTFSSDGGEASISYTGRALSASNTVTATAANDATVTASATVNYQANLWILTDNGVQDQWDYSTGTPMTYDSATGTYTANFTANVGNTFILFARKLGESNPWNTRYVFGPDSNGDWVLNGDSGSGNIDLNDDDPIKIGSAGTYTVTINSDGTFTIAKVLEQVAMPTFSPAGGTYTEAQSVSILCATDGATIYYTTDGTEPTTSSNVYSAPITVSETTTIKAIAVKSGMTNSEPASATYIIRQASTDVNVTVADGTAQTEYVPVYGYQYDADSQHNQIVYPASELGQLNDGDVITAITFYPTTATLPFSNGSVTLSMANMDQGTTIPWSVDYWGTASGDLFTNSTPALATINAPTAADGLWTITFTTPFTYTGGDLLIDVTTTKGTYGDSKFYGKEMSSVYGLATYTSYSTSKKGSSILPKATFTVETTAQETVATPTFSPAAGTYTSAQNVTIACATEGATIYYTTDGTEPSATNGTVYSEAIAVSATTTIKAIAVKDGMTNSEVATAEYVIDIPVDYDVTVTPDGGELNFGTVNYTDNSTSQKTIVVHNIGLQPVTPTLTALTAPYSTDYVATALASGESVTITITFAPTEEGTFNQDATLTFGRGTEARNFTLTGKGGIYDANDHSALYDYEYTWTDDNGMPHTSNLLETATDANQIIAMLRMIYMTPEIPGNKKRGYTREGAVENWKVSYPAVGQLTRNYVSGSGYTYEYTDAYGWNIPTEKPILNTTLGSYNYYYLDPTEYEPDEEGVTLIMIELKDLTNFSGNSNYYSISSSSLSLKEKIANAFKSARIIKDFKQSGTGEEAGTLFKIDADKLNRFFLIAKGQLRLIDHTYGNFQDGYTFSEPSYRIRNNSSSGAYTDTYFSDAVMYPFIHMFEQFSPNVASTGSTAQTDEYQKLINMESFYVIHDCPSAAFIAGNHEFNMYGLDSESDDCQDVRDMMFFVPEYRMMDWGDQYAVTDKRDFSSEKFVNYHQSHQPKMALYVIRQNEITGEKQANADVYDLNLSWESNLLDFMPGDEAEYDLYRVIIDPNTGEKTYEFVATIPSGQTTYVDHVAMENTGKVVTYVVQGQDTEHFLSLQMSNEESFIIPGLDPNELMNLDVRATHYSRFDPQSEKNFYANTLKLNNNVGTNVTSDMLTVGAQFTFNRMYTDAQGAHTDVVAIATVTRNTGSVIDLDITMQNQRELDEYPYGYKANKGAHSFNVTNGVVDFGDFTVYDNFGVSVVGNEHPTMYDYQVLFGNTHSNNIRVMVHKTGMEMIAYDQTTIDDDILHNEEILNRSFNIDVKYSSKTEILRYDAYRWRHDEQQNDEFKIIESGNTDGTNEEDVAPNGIAGNQATFYTIAMNNDYTGSVNVSQGVTAKAKFEDNFATQNWGAYVFAPVVETFTGREDYNTYGAALQGTATSSMQIAVKDTREMSEFNWTDNTTNKVYCYYTIPLDIIEMKVPEGYNVYKLRAWRKVNTDLLQEQLESRQYRLGVNGDYLFDEVAYPDYNKAASYVIGSPVVEDYQTNTEPVETGYELKATFGAQKLSDGSEAGTITSLPMEFVVRAYYTKESNLPQPNGHRAPRRVAGDNPDGKYYIMEQVIPFVLEKDDNLIVSVKGVYADKQVMDVIYYNMMGQSSSTPFSGVNVQLTRYTDGTTSTVKVFK